MTPDLAASLESLVILVALITIPAFIIFCVLMYQRNQQSKFRRGSRRRRSEEEKENGKS